MSTPIEGRIISTSPNSIIVGYEVPTDTLTPLKIEFQVDHEIDLEKLDPCGKGKFPDQEFIVFPCFSGGDKSNSYCEVKLEKIGRIGWIIPINYFSEPGLYYEENYLVDFAYAALRQSLINPTINSLSGINSKIKNGVTQTNFASLFNGITSFCVLSRDKVSNFAKEDVYFALKHQGIFLISKHSDLEFCEKFYEDGEIAPQFQKLFVADWKKKITLKLSSEIVRRHISVFQELIMPSALQVQSPWMFLSYYQVLELLIEDVLAKEVRSLAAQDYSAWKLKEKLQDISGEKKRLNIVSQSSGKASTVVFEDLHVACKKFLTSCKVENKGGENWVSSMYSCRNMLVHNQMALYREKAQADLIDINIHMMKAVLEVMIHYS